MFTFLDVQTHSRCPDVRGWWLKVPANDPKLMEAIRDHFGQISARNYEAMQKKYDATLLININGGWCILDDDMQVFNEMETTFIDWPQTVAVG